MANNNVGLWIFVLFLVIRFAGRFFRKKDQKPAQGDRGLRRTAEENAERHPRAGAGGGPRAQPDAKAPLASRAPLASKTPTRVRPVSPQAGVLVERTGSAGGMALKKEEPSNQHHTDGFTLEFSEIQVVQGIIMGEILGPPGGLSGR